MFNLIKTALKHSPSKRKLQFPTRQRPISTGDNDVGDGFRDYSSKSFKYLKNICFLLNNIEIFLKARIRIV
jgi:hypothetical protein